MTDVNEAHAEIARLRSTAAPLLSSDIPIFKEVEIDKPEADDLRLWSITTIIGVLEKRALQDWSAEMAAKAAVNIAGSLERRIQEDGVDEVVYWLKNARNRRIQGHRTASSWYCSARGIGGIRADRRAASW